MKKNIVKGKMGENLAIRVISSKGYKIIARNWRFGKYGEIDIIALDGNILVFIEVKARTSFNFGKPVEAVNKAKIEKMKILAEFFINNNTELKFEGLRFDVVGILIKEKPEVKYYNDVYQF